MKCEPTVSVILAVWHRLTCKGKEHPSRPEQVVSALPEGEDDTQSAQDHEEQTEDGDGCC